MAKLTAVEFFSGIGAFSYAARSHDIEVISAFDQYALANDTFEHNFRLRPNSKNLDSIQINQIPPADIWWMSPPCTPFSVRGKQRGLHDPRTKSFLHLIELLPDHHPQFVMVENVAAFAESDACKRLLSVARDCHYSTQAVQLCSTQFGVPMRRPRHFLVAARTGSQPGHILMPAATERLGLSVFLGAEEDELLLDSHIATKYGDGFDIVTREGDDNLICFTKNYARCMKASGSLLRLEDGRLRRFSPEEILRLLGFGNDYRFPDHIELQVKWRLVGNSVDVRAINHLLTWLMNDTAQWQSADSESRS
jgi:site-specific DNA-cytosine methylase